MFNQGELAQEANVAWRGGLGMMVYIQGRFLVVFKSSAQNSLPDGPESRIPFEITASNLKNLSVLQLIVTCHDYS